MPRRGGDVVARLRARILSNELAPGSRLNQAELAESLGVSRIPVRDALYVLAAEGLVRMNGRAGATVTQLSIADLEELYELREINEPLVTRLAVPNVGRVHLLQMAEQHRAMQTATSASAWLAANAAFHALVYRRSGRPRMIELVETLRKQTDRYLQLHLSEIGSTQHLHDEHEAILEAASHRDAPAVEALTREHLVTAHEFLLQHLLERQLVSTSPPFPTT